VPFSEQFWEYQMGESLLHGIQSASERSVSSSMPLTSRLSILLTRHGQKSREETRRWWWTWFERLQFLGVFALGGLLGSLPGAAASVICMFFAPRLIDATPTLFSMPASTLGALIIAGLLVTRARKPTFWNSLLLGASIGICLLTRSPLVLFPPFFAAAECLMSRHASFRILLARILPILIVPYLFMVPWAKMNWTLHHEFIPFEQARMENKIAQAALGFVRPNVVNWKSHSATEPKSPAAKDVLAWAAMEILRHPIRYLLACLSRFRLILSLSAILSLCALLAVVVNWRDRAMNALALLAFYLLLVHGLVSMELLFTQPLWPLLAVLASQLFPFFMGAPPPDGASRAGRFSSYFFILCLGATAFLSAQALGWVVSYDRLAQIREPKSDMALEAALANSPGDAWLLTERGRRRMAQRDLAGASRDFEKALSLQPTPEREWALAWAMSRRGHSDQLFQIQVTPDFVYPLRVPFSKAVAHLREGRTSKAREQIRSAIDMVSPQMSRCMSDLGRYQATKTTLACGLPSFINLLQEVLVPISSAERLRFFRTLLAVIPDEGPFAASDVVLLLAQLSRKLKDPVSGLALLQMATVRHPKDIRLQLAQSRFASEALQLELARRSLARAQQLQKSQGVATKDIERSMEEIFGRFSYATVAPVSPPPPINKIAPIPIPFHETPEKILARLISATNRDPNDIKSWLDVADAALAAGQPNLARKARIRGSELARKAKLNIAPPQRLILAAQFQRLGDYSKAIEILDNLDRQYPGNVEIVYSRGVCHYLKGSKPLAIQDFVRAIEIDAGYLQAYLSLAAVYGEQRRYREALALYDRGIKSLASDEVSWLRLRADQKELLSFMARSRK
jgi:tetratricopeptide (TPR) repeat protein